LYWIFNIY